MFEWKTSAIKFISCACCVGAGLPVGPEGPMIFLGATLGGLVSQGTVNFTLMPSSKFRDAAESALSSAGAVLWPFKRFRNKSDQRDFMTAGCAAGVAGAFGAPIGASATHAAFATLILYDARLLCAGGLLFAMEEVASFWNINLGWQIFFACMTAVFARAFAESLYEGENPGLFNNTIAYEINRKVNTHVLAMGVAVFIGAACGLTAALFTRVNLKWCVVRAASCVRRAADCAEPQVAVACALRRCSEVEALCRAYGLYVHLLHHRHDAALRVPMPRERVLRRRRCATQLLHRWTHRSLLPRPAATAGVVTCSNDNASLLLQNVVEPTTETFICRSVR